MQLQRRRLARQGKLLQMLGAAVTMLPAVRAVVKAQMNLTNQVLAGADTRGNFKALMTEMFNFPKTSCPFQRGDHEPGAVLR